MDFSIDFLNKNLRDENNVILLNPVKKNEFNVLYDLLENIVVPYKSERTNNTRFGFPKHRATIFGFTRGRFSGKYGLSRMSLKHPNIYNEIVRIGNLICPFNFTSIYVNKNVVCPKHKDIGNKGNSLIVSFGDYHGCNLIINEKMYDANCQPILFNGSELEHYNTELISGTKYSLVFFR